MNKIYIDGEEYRYVELRGRGKYISKDGKAVNPIRRKQPCTIHYNPDGYPCFGGGVPVHLYVAHGWVDGYFDGAEVDNIDFNILNYNADNLRWVTHIDNIKHSLDDNYNNWCKSKQGEHNGRAKFKPEEIIDMRNKYDIGWSIADITKYLYPDKIHVKDYKNIYSNISKIVKRETWKHLT